MNSKTHIKPILSDHKGLFNIDNGYQGKTNDIVQVLDFYEINLSDVFRLDLRHQKDGRVQLLIGYKRSEDA